MLILAFDTSMAACSVTLWDGQVLSARRETMDRGQAEALMPMIDAVMAGRSYAAVDRIAVTTGPGSFTGVRVGLAAARGLSLASGKPCVGLLTTEVLAAAVPEGERSKVDAILAAIDTKRGDLYVQRFATDGRALSEPGAMAPSALAAWNGAARVVLVGDGASLAQTALAGSVISAAAALPDAAVLAQLAQTRTSVPGGPAPVYVHPPSITPERARG